MHGLARVARTRTDCTDSHGLHGLARVARTARTARTAQPYVCRMMTSTQSASKPDRPIAWVICCLMGDFAVPFLSGQELWFEAPVFIKFPTTPLTTLRPRWRGLRSRGEERVCAPHTIRHRERNAYTVTVPSHRSLSCDRSHRRYNLHTYRAPNQC